MYLRREASWFISQERIQPGLYQPKLAHTGGDTTRIIPTKASSDRRGYNQDYTNQSYLRQEGIQPGLYQPKLAQTGTYLHREEHISTKIYILLQTDTYVAQTETNQHRQGHAYQHSYVKVSTEAYKSVKIGILYITTGPSQDGHNDVSTDMNFPVHKEHISTDRHKYVQAGRTKSANAGPSQILQVCQYRHAQLLIPVQKEKY